MSTTEPLPDDELPPFFMEADAASARGQRRTIVLNVVRLVAAVVAALAGVLRSLISEAPGTSDASATAEEAVVHTVVGAVVVAGFAAALVAEIVLLVLRPEREWYAGRAAAESAKTLAWRYAVGADPFDPEVDDTEAHRVLRERLAQVDAKAGAGIGLDLSTPLVTTAMTELRTAPFAQRRAAYLSGRTRRQHAWYLAKARHNRRWSVVLRSCLIVFELVALVVAVVDELKSVPVDYAGFIAAVVAAGAAYLSLRQFEPLATAYGTTARELAVQIDVLASVDEGGWSKAVADSEEAISREHTMWLATRLGDEG